jgi:hypothetical protein
VSDGSRDQGGRYPLVQSGEGWVGVPDPDPTRSYDAYRVECFDRECPAMQSDELGGHSHIVESSTGSIALTRRSPAEARAYLDGLDAGMSDHARRWREMDVEQRLLVLAMIAPEVEEPAAPVAAAYRRPRLRYCVGEWPGAEVEGEFDQRCCRFPKSCSASVYRDDLVKPEDLEGPNLGVCEGECTHPVALHGPDGCNAQWAKPGGGLQICACTTGRVC